MKRRTLLVGLGMAALALAASGTITFAAASGRSTIQTATRMGARVLEMRGSQEAPLGEGLGYRRGQQGVPQPQGNPPGRQADENQPACDCGEERLNQRERNASGECTCEDGNCQYREQNRNENCACQENGTPGLRAGIGADSSSAPAGGPGRNWGGQNGQGTRSPMGSSMMRGGSA